MGSAGAGGAYSVLLRSLRLDAHSASGLRGMMGAATTAAAFLLSAAPLYGAVQPHSTACKHAMHATLGPMCVAAAAAYRSTAALAGFNPVMHMVHMVHFFRRL